MQKRSLNIVPSPLKALVKESEKVKGRRFEKTSNIIFSLSFDLTRRKTDKPRL